MTPDPRPPLEALAQRWRKVAREDRIAADNHEAVGSAEWLVESHRAEGAARMDCADELDAALAAPPACRIPPATLRNAQVLLTRLRGEDANVLRRLLDDLQEALAARPTLTPDVLMLAALREVAHHADDECGFMEQVRKAIAHAEAALARVEQETATPSCFICPDCAPGGTPQETMESLLQRAVDAPKLDTSDPIAVKAWAERLAADGVAAGECETTVFRAGGTPQEARLDPIGALIDDYESVLGDGVVMGEAGKLITAARAEVERLRASPGAGEARLRELAREGAKRAHLAAVMSGHHVKVFAETGHQWVGGGDTWQGFFCCPHSDCVLVRAGLVPGQEKEKP